MRSVVLLNHIDLYDTTALDAEHTADANRKKEQYAPTQDKEESSTEDPASPGD